MKRLLCVLPALLASYGIPAAVFAQPDQTLPRASSPPSTTPSATMPSATTPSAKIAIPSREVQEKFLLTGDIGPLRPIATGLAHTSRASMTDGKLTHDVHVQCIDEYRPVFRGKDGTVEKNFRDTYKFNIAAYRLDKILNINMIPVSVERQVDGKQCAVTWWIDDVRMTEEQRRDKQIKPPAAQFWVDQLNKVRVFDQLIYNMDRNQGNLVITNEWRLWMIDHTRAFRTAPTLLKPDALIRCDYSLLTNLKKLNRATLTKELVPYVRPEEITGLLARRDLIVKFFETQVKAKGDDAVLTGIPRSTPQVSIP